MPGWPSGATPPSPHPVPPGPASLEGVRLFESTTDAAPRLWVTRVTTRAEHGAALRRLQQEAFHHRERIADLDPERAPHLGLVASPTFLLLFPLDTNAFARRQRFTQAQIESSSALAEHFLRMSAAVWAGLAVARPDDDSLEGLTSDERHYDWTALYVGSGLDQAFVDFMDFERRKLLETVLDPGRAPTEVFRPLLRPLDIDEAIGPEALLSRPMLRKQVVAVIDTVLLRMVLYRYLERQYEGIDEAERSRIGFVVPEPFDDLIEKTTHRSDAAVESRRQDIQRHKQGKLQQLDLFAAEPVQVEPEHTAAFKAGVDARHAAWQQSGGDLHRGQLAAAADVVQKWLIDQRTDVFATLIDGTRHDAYAFTYEDLDPRALQRFYEDTIGTDVSLSAGDGRMRVVPRMRARKEQGAYFTDERLCGWLVQRTLGTWFEGWRDTLQGLLAPGRTRTEADLDALTTHLRRLTDRRIIDPTCGGGIFLRSAFEAMASMREQIAPALANLTAPLRMALRARDPIAGLLLPEAEPGEWEWHLLLNVLYGVDIDIKAINIASNLLTLSALIYRPRGLAFPSFINVNLKQGNALVTPVSDRADFARRWQAKIVLLLGLRRRLRDPHLPTDQWAPLHAQTAEITREITEAETERAFGKALGKGVAPEEWAARVKQVGCFVYEAEFPEVFFDGEGTVRADAGFDAVLGNPPWEEPAAEYKKFLPEYDPDYGELAGKASEEREQALLADPAIAAAWAAHHQGVQDIKALLIHSGYQHQRRAVKGKIPGAHTNLYKYATEMAWRLLSPDGSAGLVLDGGLWNDLAANGLRRLLIDESRLDALMGFTNKDGIFADIDGRQKFGCFVFARRGPTVRFPTVFMRTDLDDLARFDDLAGWTEADAIRNDPRDSYPLPEVRNAEHGAAELALSTHPVLGGPPWSLDKLAEELNAGRQRIYFRPSSPGFLPVIQGTQFNHWGVHDGEPPTDWLDPAGEGISFIRDRQEGRILKAIYEFIGATTQKEEAARAWLRRKTGQSTVPPEWVRLDLDGYRLAWRDIARNDDRRTLIAAILPPNVAVTHKAPFVRPFTLEITEDGPVWRPQLPAEQLLYLAAMLSSYACDAVVRSRMAKTNMTGDAFLGLPVPPWQPTPTHQRIAHLAAQLTCRPAPPDRPWADYTALAAEVGQHPDRDGLVDPTARRAAEVELNALANRLYGLDPTAFRFLMNTLFDTPRHRDTHFEYRDAILHRGW